MRAKNLSDLIFNGGQGKQGADQCIVSLVFDNADRAMPVEADTVTLTRKVKRAPTPENKDAYNSYFYVNGRASQKKEFVDLLNHARISADGYNLVKQDDVKLICTMPPQKRREILDDIAGVTTFDKDIAQADARKADVLGNLERIKIVLDEIGRSLTQLEREKGAAQKYRDLQDSIRRLKGLMAWRRKADLEAQVAQVQSQVAQFTAERAKHEAELRKVADQHKEVQARFAETESEMRAQGGEEVQKIQGDIEKARDAMVRLEEKINFAKAELATAAEEAVPLTEELRKIEKELERTRKAQAECAKEAETASKAMGGKKKDLEDLRTLISKTDSGALQINRDLSELKHEHEDKQLKLHETRLEMDRAQERLRGRLHLADVGAPEEEALEAEQHPAEERVPVRGVEEALHLDLDAGPLAPEVGVQPVRRAHQVVEPCDRRVVGPDGPRLDHHDPLGLRGRQQHREQRHRPQDDQPFRSHIHHLPESVLLLLSPAESHRFDPAERQSQNPKAAVRYTSFLIPHVEGRSRNRDEHQACQTYAT